LLGKKKDNNPNSDNNHDGDKHVSSNSASEKGRRQAEKEEDERNKSLSKGTKFVASNEAKYILIGVAAVAIFWFGLKAVLQVNNPFYVVSSESMVPTLRVGDLLVLRNGNDGSGFSFHDLQVGDIIVFHSEDGGGRTIVHRIVEIYRDNNEGEEKLVKTKGDNNPASYEVLDYPIKEADYYGKVISIIPKVGLVTMPPYNYIIAGIAAGLVSVTGILAYIIVNYQKKNNDDSNSKKNKE
jgi:signal peptidase I